MDDSGSYPCQRTCDCTAYLGGGKDVNHEMLEFSIRGKEEVGVAYVVRRETLCFDKNLVSFCSGAVE